MRLEQLLSRQMMAADFGQIEGRVYSDLAGDGTLDASDPGIPAIVLTLYRDVNNNGTLELGTDTEDQTTTSDANGDFVFDRLDADDYLVSQDAVAGQSFAGTGVTAVTITDTQAAGEGDTGQVLIDQFDGATQTAADSSSGAAVTTSTLVDSGVLGGERDILVTLTSATGDVTATVNGTAQQTFDFNSNTSATGTAEIQWDGPDGDAASLDTAGLGSVDLTAAGGAGFLVEIGANRTGGSFDLTFYSGAGNSSTYRINSSDQLPSIDAFTIGFDDAPLSTTGSGADFAAITAIDGMLTTTLVSTDVRINVVGAVAPSVTTVNMGNIIPLTIGNQVFADVNDNGTLDSGEAGIDGVTVVAYTDTDGDGSFDSTIDTQVGSTTTAGGGFYEFTDLDPGDYFVQIPPSEFALGSALSGYQTSLSGTPAADPDDDIDDDDNGTAVASEGVVSAAITLVSLSEPTDDSDADSNTNLSLDFGFVPQVDVEVVKSVLSSAPTAGRAATYRVTVTNNGPLAATGVVVTDLLPAGVSNPVVTTTQGTSTFNGSDTLTIDVGTMAAAAEVIIDVTVDVPADASGAYNNQASVTSDGFDTDTANNLSDVDLNPTRAVDLSLTKTASVASLTAGEAFSYTITIDNAGPSTATAVTIIDVLPMGIAFDSGTITQGGISRSTGISDASGTVTALIGDVAVGEEVILVINVTAGAAADGDSDNLASVSSSETDENPADNSDNAIVAVASVIDLAVDKTSPATATAGGELVYTISVQNNGPSNATGVTVVDTLPSGVTFVSGTGGTFTETTPGTVTVDVGSLAAGATATLTLTVALEAAATGTLTNAVEVSGSQTELATTAGDNTDSLQTPIVQSIDLGIGKSDSIDPVVPGNQLVYTITVANGGLSTATGVILEENLPTGVTFVGLTEGGADLTASVTQNGQNITLPLGTLAPTDAARIFEVTALVASSVTATLSNTATVRSDQQASETNTANNSTTETTGVNPTAVLTVTKNDNVDSAVPGGTVTYTIQVSNAGPSDATGVMVTDSLPSGVTVQSSSAPGGTAAQSGSTLTLPFGSIAPGGTAQATVTVLIPTTTLGSLSNSVTAAGTGISGGTLTATETTPLVPDFDLTVTKTASASSVTVGQQVTFEIIVSNAATSVSAATGVTLTDTLPAGLTLVSASGPSDVIPGGTITNLSNIALGTLQPDESVTITVVAQVASSVTGGTLTNAASVQAASEPASATLPNSAQSVLTVLPVSSNNGAIGGRVVIDSNRDNVLAGTEPGVPMATVTLVNTGTGTATTTSTDAAGNFLFEDLAPGTYRVTRTLPAGFIDGVDVVGSGAQSASTASDDSLLITLAGTQNQSLDSAFGLQVLASKWWFIV